MKSENTQFFEIKKILEEKGLVVLRPDEYEDIYELVQRYYKDDALMKWFAGRDKAGIVSEKMFKIAVSFSKESLIYYDSKDRNALTIWLHSEVDLKKIFKILKTGGSEIINLGGLNLLKKVIVYEYFANRIKHRQSGKHCWHLFVFAVKDGKAGRYIYSEKMLNPITKYAWENNIPCYAEVNKPEDIPALQKAGFQIRGSEKVPGSDINHYVLMI